MVALFEEAIKDPQLWDSPVFVRLQSLFAPLEEAFTECRESTYDGNTTKICLPNFWENEEWDAAYTRWSSLPYQFREIAKYMRARGDGRKR